MDGIPITDQASMRHVALKETLYVGDLNTVAEKIIHLRKNVGITRFMLHVPVGTMPHEDVMKAIELLGKEVVPKVREEVARWEAKGWREVGGVCWEWDGADEYKAILLRHYLIKFGWRQALFSRCSIPIHRGKICINGY